ncbi:E3 ubiquitin-protein ligase TRIM9-like [Littorina saxatilis]|uniref:E3 ubiquitin-protein ligase TRIM9-like n=1 Tax=Littorina saxatilis TaxID=31220 RepID=UPI0038B5045D
MADSVSGNCMEFEKTVVAQCDALMEIIRQRKEELLANVHEEREVKISTLKEQVADCTNLLHRTTGLLQYCIEVLKESDYSSFLQVSPGLINRVSMADINFNKEMELAPRVSPEFELTLDNTPCIHTIQNMNFFQMKGKRGKKSETGRLYWLFFKFKNETLKINEVNKKKLKKLRIADHTKKKKKMLGYCCGLCDNRQNIDKLANQTSRRVTHTSQQQKI